MEILLWILGGLLALVLAIPIALAIIYYVARVISYGVMVGKSKFERDQSVSKPGEFENGK